ncbi:transposase family protein [Cellulomonas composti]|uniref:transposase family protein n=1 Tax=Cellulomonas composti TaxID=266130 RepID=UPI001FE7FD2E|nr:transposase family protein [Cellulomonas composti]
MVATRVHARREQVVRDVPVGGPVRVVWAKRRWVCAERLCGRRARGVVVAGPGCDQRGGGAAARGRRGRRAPARDR